MDNNWLMAALQSPEGMNFLNMWRQKMGMPGTGGVNQGAYRPGSLTGTGGVNQGIYRGGIPSTTGLSGVSLSAAGPQPQIAQSPNSGIRNSFAAGGNDLAAGPLQSNPMPTPFWGSSN